MPMDGWYVTNAGAIFNDAYMDVGTSLVSGTDKREPMDAGIDASRTTSKRASSALLSLSP